jgi:hypothetical protein
LAAVSLNAVFRTSRGIRRHQFLRLNLDRAVEFG